MELETARLRMRRLTLDDLPFLTELHRDERVARFLGNGRPRDAAASREWLDAILHLYETDAIGHLAVERKDDGRLVGRCGMTWFEVATEGDPPLAYWGRGSAPPDVDVMQELEVGYTFSPEFWGHGFATEASARVCEAAFETGRATQLISVIHADNHASLRVAEKNGFTDGGQVSIDGRTFSRRVRR